MKLPQPSRLPEPMHVPGMPLSLGERLRRLPRWVWFIVGVAMIPLVSLPVMGLTRYTTTQPAYCLTCHGTGETPNIGIPSKVHPSYSRVGCVECHGKPNQIVFEGYMKGFMAEPERVNNNCSRCHDKMTQRNDQSGFKFNPIEIKVPHKLHRDLGVGCTTCHSNVAHDWQIPQTNRPTMKACYQCHNASSEACNKCHGKAP